MRRYSLVIKIVALCLFSDLLESLAQVFFKFGTNSVGAISTASGSDIITFIVSGIRSPFIWFGILTLIVQFFTWMTVLAKSDLHFAFIASSTNYILVLLLSKMVFGEHINLIRWIGVFIIMAGIILASYSYAQKR